MFGVTGSVLRDICIASSSCFLSEVIAFLGYFGLSDSVSLLKQTLEGFICSRARRALPGGIKLGESDSVSSLSDNVCLRAHLTNSGDEGGGGGLYWRVLVAT